MTALAVAGEHPGREEGQEMGEPGRGGHGVHADGGAAVALGVQVAQDALHLHVQQGPGDEAQGRTGVVGQPLQPLEGRLLRGTEPGDGEDVGDVAPDAVGPGDLPHLGDGAPQGGVGVGTEVAGEDALVRGEHARQFHQFRGVGLAAREVLETGGEAEGARLHALGQQLLHHPDLLRGAEPVGEAGGGDAHHPVRRQQGGVEEGAARLHEVHEAGHAFPADIPVEVHLGEDLQVGLDALPVFSGDGGQGHAAVAAHVGGDALFHQGGQEGGVVVAEEGQVGVGVDVDEAGADHLAA